MLAVRLNPLMHAWLYPIIEHNNHERLMSSTPRPAVTPVPASSGNPCTPRCTWRRRPPVVSVSTSTRAGWVRSSRPPPGTASRRSWWAADSGIFGSNYVGDEAYMRWLTDRAEHADRCLFATAPDVVGNAFDSVSRSYPFLQRIRDMGYPVALVAQDYMEFCPYWDWDDFDCFFVGGSTSWKLSPAAAVLARAAAAAGRVGPRRAGQLTQA